MTTYALVRLLSGIFSVLENHVIPWLREVRSWLRSINFNWLKKLEFPRIPNCNALPPDSRFYKLLSGAWFWFTDALIYVSGTALLLGVFYIVWS